MNIPPKYEIIKVLNVASNSKDDTESLLSSLAYSPFIMDNKEYASVEAFWQ
jgi:hypothetical protein